MGYYDSALDGIIGSFYSTGKKDQSQHGQYYEAGKRAGQGARRPSVSRMSRVGAKDGKAIFKLIRKGGTESRDGLKGQIKYILNDEKAARVIDPSGMIERYPDNQLLAINRITANWENTWWKNTRNGQTSHMILSFPQKATLDQVEKTVRGVANEMFDTGDRQFKYLIAIHDDKEHHPHAHIIVNRRASDNSLFTLREGTAYSYEGFREAMAAHAARHGLYLDPTYRFERGITARQPSYAAQNRAMQERAGGEHLKLKDRPASDKDLDYSHDLIAAAEITYQAMAVIAHSADTHRLADAYAKLAFNLSEGGTYIMPDLNQEELAQFEEYKALLSDGIERAEKALQTKDPVDRLPYEKNLVEVMRVLTQFDKQAPYARDLHDDPRGNSIYMHELTSNAERLNTPKVKEELRELCSEWGLDAKTIEARLGVGTDNFYLEKMWVREDLGRIATATGRDLTIPEVREQTLQEAYSGYHYLREYLVGERIINDIAHLRPDYEYTPDTDRYAAELKYFKESRLDAPDDIDKLQKLLRDALSDQDYDRLRNGDLEPLRDITDDEYLAHRMALAIESYERDHGYNFSKEASSNFDEIQMERDRLASEQDYGRER